MTGFEPATSRSQSECSTKLSYIPLRQVPIAASPEPTKRGLPQLISQQVKYSTTYASCQMVPSVPIHICGPDAFL